jgi:hypothetical protein
MADEITTLMVGDGSEVVNRRDVVVAQQASLFHRISEIHVGHGSTLSVAISLR